LDKSWQFLSRSFARISGPIADGPAERPQLIRHPSKQPRSPFAPGDTIAGEQQARASTKPGISVQQEGATVGTGHSYWWCRAIVFRKTSTKSYNLHLWLQLPPGCFPGSGDKWKAMEPH
jgi:hypothetical protein